MKTFVFDIDGTICTNTFGKYELAQPFKERISYINELYEDGNVIKYFTARGSTTGIDWYELTKSQLEQWGALHHKLILNKPEGDIYIDDKGFNSEYWKFPSANNHPISRKHDHSLLIKEPISNQIKVLNDILIDKRFVNGLQKISNKIKNTFNKGGKIIFAGNGGSFSDAQHITAEFVCKFATDRNPLPAITLGTNSSNLTAIGNDYGFEYIFSRELKAIGKKDDLVITFTTSGKSKNIISLIEKADSLGIPFFILTGKTGGDLSKYEDYLIKVPSEDTGTIQQIHILIGHIICKNAEIPFLN